MAISIDGTGTITGISVGGLNDSIITSSELANAAVTSAKLASGVGGKVLQVVYGSSNSVFSTLASIPNDDTIPQNTEGLEFLTQSITPVSASSDLIIQVNCPCITSNMTGNHMVALFRDSTANAIASASTVVASNDYEEVLTLVHKEAASSTNETTFKCRFGSNSTTYTTYLNQRVGGRILGGTLAVSIVIYEVAA